MVPAPAGGRKRQTRRRGRAVRQGHLSGGTELPKTGGGERAAVLAFGASDQLFSGTVSSRLRVAPVDWPLRCARRGSGHTRPPAGFIPLPWRVTGTNQGFTVHCSISGRFAKVTPAKAAGQDALVVSSQLSRLPDVLLGTLALTPSASHGLLTPHSLSCPSPRGGHRPVSDSS